MGVSPNPRPHSVTDFDTRGALPSTNLQNFYATHRQPSRGGSNEAEQIMQTKRRQAAQRERELRNYHQDQQFNRSRPPSYSSCVTPQVRSDAPHQISVLANSPMS